ncbi:cellobiohydrolase-like protein II precursor [Crepidotus variabilis]|uniref:Glucanase n=1 Tax=Crepidotus variabilis TaxID=179855 RepID=A0A9P6JRX2_9AGAR|nr:cellobiohydrolase-like protein II precursor [Crepidotus variabilis]
MKFSALLAAVTLATGAYALPANETVEKRATCSPVTLSGNPFTSRKLFANSHYGDYVKTAAAAITDSTLSSQALKVADVGSFLWLDTISALDTLDGHLKSVPCDQVIGIVVYDLPGRDCAAKASNGELAVGQLSTYKSSYIDALVKIIKANTGTAIVALVEPDSLPNLVTNADLSTCKASKTGYEDGVAYALKSLNLPNVVQYVDAGHGGWLGWNDNLKPGAEELAKVYKAAGSPKNVRGFATNVAGWNAWSKTPGEFENAPDGQWNKAQDEKRYVSLFSAALKTAGFPNYAIVDTGRNAVQGLRDEWGDWCNVNGAGFGVRPTSSTGDSQTDAFVWVKPGGESDGTSDSTANRYDSFCGKADAYKPAPEAGTWNQAYFEMLLKNAIPQF